MSNSRFKSKSSWEDCDDYEHDDSNNNKSGHHHRSTVHRSNLSAAYANDFTKTNAGPTIAFLDGHKRTGAPKRIKISAFRKLLKCLTTTLLALSLVSGLVLSLFASTSTTSAFSSITSMMVPPGEWAVRHLLNNSNNISSINVTNSQTAQAAEESFRTFVLNVRAGLTSAKLKASEAGNDSLRSMKSIASRFFSASPFASFSLDHYVTTEKANKNDRSIVEQLQQHDVDLPSWMKEYFLWHHTQRSEWNLNNWQSKRYLLVRCWRIDGRCGGASDRLQALPAYLLMAFMSNRILLFDWERPCSLQEFLVPPASTLLSPLLSHHTNSHFALDWTLPQWLKEAFNAGGTNVEIRSLKLFAFHFQDDSPLGGSQNQTLLQTRMQLHDYGKPFFNGYVQQIVKNEIFQHQQQQQHQQSSDERATAADADAALAVDSINFFDLWYPLIWNSIFQPSPKVAAEIDQARMAVGLPSSTFSLSSSSLLRQIKGNKNRIEYSSYSAVHIRSIYLKDESGSEAVLHNAMSCAHQFTLRRYQQEREEQQRQNQLPPSQQQQLALPPILITTDKSEVTQRALDFSQEIPWLQNRTFLTPPHQQNHTDVLHLDRGSRYLEKKPEGWDWEKYPPSAYYNVWVDLYLLKDADCIVYHHGGYARWTLLMSSTNIGIKRKKQQNNICALNHAEVHCNETGIFRRN